MAMPWVEVLALDCVRRHARSTSRPADCSISHSRIIGSPSNAVGSSPRMHSKSAHPSRSARKPPAQSYARSCDTYASMSFALSDRNLTANGTMSVSTRPVAASSTAIPVRNSSHLPLAAAN